MTFFVLFYLKKINCNVYDILKLVYTLSHGLSSVEKEFSINKEHVENLQEELIAFRTLNDHKSANN